MLLVKWPLLVVWEQRGQEEQRETFSSTTGDGETKTSLGREEGTDVRGLVISHSRRIPVDSFLQPNMLH